MTKPIAKREYADGADTMHPPGTPVPDWQQMRWYDKMLYALAHSIPRSSFAESVYVGRMVMAAAGIVAPGFVLTLVIVLTGTFIRINFSELLLCAFAVGAFIAVTHYTMSVSELEQVEVPKQVRRRWTRRSLSAIAATFIGFPILLVVLLSLLHR